MNADPAQPADAAAAQAGDDLLALAGALERAAAANDGSTPGRLLEDAAQALRASQSALEAERTRYRALFDAVPDPVSVLTRDGTVLDLNKAGIRAYKRPREEIVGKSIGVLNPDLPRDHMAPVLETLDRGETYVIEVTNMRADGTRFPVEVHSANLLYDGHDAIVAVARDLSQRQEAEIRYRELMESIDKGILIQDGDGRFVYGNPAAMRILGLRSRESLAEALGQGRWKILHEDGREMAHDELPTVRAQREGRIVESTVIGMYHLQRRQLLWLAVTAVPQYAPGADRPGQILALFSDVTELKRDGTWFDRAQALARIGGWQWDRAADEFYITEEAVRILGAASPPTDLAGFLACLREPDRRQVHAVLDKVRLGTGFELELQGAQADGTPFWIRMIGESESGGPATELLTGTLQDVTERKQAEETLRVQAQTDALTGLLNRDAILTQMDLRLADPPANRFALLYIDLDRFKIVNDVLGHGAGDLLLIAAARRIRDAVGSEGLIARFGGDEFLVLCNTGDDAGRPQRLARQMQLAFHDSFRLADDEFSITASIGISRAPDDGETPQQLIQSADVAMYDSTRRARNSWQEFSPELAARQHERLQTETQLRRALDNGEFHLVYQPQVDLRSGRILYAEALVRWHNPQLGEMRPDRFIELAETTGDIIRIGNWVLQEACAQMRRWREADLPVQRVAVNVSYRQFVGDDLAARVQRMLDAAGLPGHALELEITERVLVDDTSDTVEVFDRLRRLGVQLSIDDFGEGYSALNYLRRLPIHALKLSHSFLKGVPGKPSDVAICQAVIGIAQSLGLGIVAEGVETEAQRDFLLRLGVSVGQGFLFAPGLLPGEFTRRVAIQQEQA
jgi:diguanylate cyclase (GGDEF)-like protein/PAS domain S-box-containing protein